MTEQWRPIPGHPKYEASNLGRVRSLHGEEPQCLTAWTAKGTGYRQLDLSGKRFSVHRLVAAAWCEGFFDGAWVDHLNGDRADNRADNLEWVTPSENAKRGFQKGRTNPFKGKSSGAHPTAKPVASRCLRTKEVTFWPSAMDAVRAGFDSSCITRCCKGQSKYHKGHEWRYGDRHGVRWSEPVREYA